MLEVWTGNVGATMNDWAKFFNGFADQYDGEMFTRNTEAELGFLREHLGVGERGRVLDLGCGTGRHSVGLARLGYQVTGVDLSAGMLEVARQRAVQAGVTVEWVCANATEFMREEQFDGAICLCEGSMGLLAGDDDPLDHDMAILRNIRASLADGGRLILNVLNACRMIRTYSDDDVAAGKFNVLDLTETSDVIGLMGEEGKSLRLRERGYTPPEIRRMLIWAGLVVDGVYGGTAGEWGLHWPRLDEMELMIFGRKPSAS